MLNNKNYTKNSIDGGIEYMHEWLQTHFINVVAKTSICLLIAFTITVILLLAHLLNLNYIDKIIVAEYLICWILAFIIEYLESISIEL